MANHWHMASGATWADGDFNGDKAVDDKDASLLAVNWGWTRTAEGEATRAGALDAGSVGQPPWPWPGSAIGDVSQ